MKHWILAVCIAALFATGSSAHIPQSITQDIKKEIVSINGVKMFAHVVKKGETLYSLCKAYDTTAEQLQKSNPSLSEGLKEGMILYIPVADREEDPAVEEKSGRKRPLFGKRSKERQERRKARRETKPAQEQVVEEQSSASEENIRDTTDAFTGLFPESYSQHTYGNITKEHSTIAFLLPLSRSNGTVNNSYMDFYAGALLAAEDLKSENYNLTLNIIDYSPNISADAVMNSEKVRDADLLIGPVRSKDIEEFIRFAESNVIPVVSPLDPSADSLVRECEFLFQAPVSQDIQNSSIVEMIADKYSFYEREGIGANVVVVSQEGSKDSKTAGIIVEELIGRGIQPKQISYDILKSRSMEHEFKTKIPADGVNLVAVISNNEAFASDALRNIDILSAEEGHITLFGTSRWRGFEAIGLNLYFKYNMQLAMPYYIDLGSEKVQNFIRRFRSLFNTEPSANAFSGYDLTTYFAMALRSGLRDYLSGYKAALQSGDSETAARYIEFVNLSAGRAELLQQNLEFIKDEGYSGFRNKGLKVIRYNSDYTVAVCD